MPSRKIQKKMGSLQCVLACVFLKGNLYKMLIHTLHKNVFSPLSVCMCFFTWELAKMMIDTLQKKMVALRCVIACVVSSHNF